LPAGLLISSAVAGLNKVACVVTGLLDFCVVVWLELGFAGAFAGLSGMVTFLTLLF
jgi:hypothetical protein